jgi:hypothetical protein
MGAPDWAQTPPPMPTPYPGPIVPVGPPIGFASPFVSYRPPAREFLRKIGDGIRWYLVVLLIDLIVGVLSAVLTGYVLSPTLTLGGSSLPSAGVAGISTVALIAVSGLVFLAFVFTIVAWVVWRSGIRPLPDVAGEFGPAYAASAREAARDYGRTVLAFVALLLSGVVFAVVLEAYDLSRVVGECARRFPVNNTTCAPAPVSTASTGSLAIILAFGAVAAVLGFLEYYFASRSLVDALRPLVSTTEQARLDRGRVIMVMGAALVPVGLVNAVLLLGSRALFEVGLAGLIAPILLFLGLYQIHRVYAAWSKTPAGPVPPLAAYPSPSPPVATPYGAPPPPPAWR